MQSMNETNMLPAVVTPCPCAQAFLPVTAPDKAYEDHSNIFGSMDSQTEAGQTAIQTDSASCIDSREV